jgi:alcohol dehydrogenase class IV
MKFEFATAARIIFGPGTCKEAGRLAAELGRRVMVVIGRTVERSKPLLDQLSSLGLEYTCFQVGGEPTIQLVLEGVRQARTADSDLVIGFGGGSVIDTGKVIAALLTNEGQLMDYLEVIGGGQPLRNASATYIAVPTTAGTGAEVTRNAVVESPEHQVKVSMRSPLMLPHTAIVDPELTYAMPPAITATTGLDAFTQLLEAFVSHQTNPLTDGICREGLRRAGRSLQTVYEDGTDTAARKDMCLASLFGGLALANAKLGAIHGFAGPLGGMLKAPHGALCARLLPYVIETNITALQTRMPNSPALARYAEMVRILTGNNSARVREGISWINKLCRQFDLKPLSAYGLNETRCASVVEKAKKASSMQGNPIVLTDSELKTILIKAL